MPFGSEFPEIQFEVAHAEEGVVLASLRPATKVDAARWHLGWRPTLVAVDRPDGRWPWAEHIERAEREDGWLALAMTRASQLDGLISLRLAKGESRLAPGADLIYIEYVGVAPEHMQPPVGRRSIRGIGSLLVVTTIRISEDLGFGGRVGLHSKPDVEDFYRRQRFTELGAEETEDGSWVYFEITPEDARVQLSAAGAPP